MFKIPLSEDEYSYCYMEDFNKIVELTKAKLKAENKPSQLLGSVCDSIFFLHEQKASWRK